MFLNFGFLLFYISILRRRYCFHYILFLLVGNANLASREKIFVAAKNEIFIISIGQHHRLETHCELVLYLLEVYITDFGRKKLILLE